LVGGDLEYMVQEIENMSHNSPRLNIITCFFVYTLPGHFTGKVESSSTAW